MCSHDPDSQLWETELQRESPHLPLPWAMSSPDHHHLFSPPTLCRSTKCGPSAESHRTLNVLSCRISMRTLPVDLRTRGMSQCPRSGRAWNVVRGALPLESSSRMCRVFHPTSTADRHDELPGLVAVVSRVLVSGMLSCLCSAQRLAVSALPLHCLIRLHLTLHTNNHCVVGKW